MTTSLDENTRQLAMVAWLIGLVLILWLGMWERPAEQIQDARLEALEARPPCACQEADR